MKRALILILITLMAGCEKKQQGPEDPLVSIGKLLGSEEHVLLGKINSAATPEEREKLIAELEATPVKIYHFHSRWSLIHKVDSSGWTESGFDPSLSEAPRDIAVMEATAYGVSDIENGGLHQFFGNSTGIFAPEMVEWFERAGMPGPASILKQAMAKFGEPYPRSQAARQRFLEGFKGEKREEWDPFIELDQPFYDGVNGSAGGFDAAADRWLKEVCGIKDLRTPCPKQPAK